MPALLVFEAIPEPAKTMPAQSQLERARTVDYAIHAIVKAHARRKVAYDLKHTKKKRV